MGRIVNKADYTFNKTAKTITFSSTYTGLELAQIQLITDVTNNTIIYQFNKPTLGGTWNSSTRVLTLTYDTTGAGFANTDDLMIIINESQDNTQLYSGTLSATGATSGVLTTDQQSLSIQLSGTWEGVVMVEGSNDNSFYIPLMVLPINDVSLVDNINESGIFNLTTSTKYVRLNVQQLQTGSITALILGRTIAGPNASNNLSLAMDRTQNTPLNTLEANPLKRDVNSALIPSDAPAPIVINGTFAANQPMGVIDTIGYQSLSVHCITAASALILQVSNDGINWIQSCPFYNSGNIGTSASVTSGQIASIPVTLRYARFICSVSVTALVNIYLRQIPASPIGGGGPSVNVTSISTATLPTNISQISGTAPTQMIRTLSSGGASTLNGSLVMGSNEAPGSTNVAYPIIIGGRQAPQTGALGGTVRTMLLDSDGRVQIAGDQTKALGTGTSLQVISSNFQNGNSLSVTDLSQFEGQSQIELMSQILTELKIMNQYMYELPTLLNGGLKNSDEPNNYRNDQSAFKI